MPFLFAIFGLVAGMVLDRHGGWLYGGLAGLAIGLLITTRQRLEKVENELARLRKTARLARAPEAARAPDGRDDFHSEERLEETVAKSRAATEPDRVTGPERSEGVQQQPLQQPTPPKDTKPPIWQPVQDWLTGGNIMVRVGVVVLFFGVAFLLKFAADHALLPVELRLAGVAAGGIVMLVLGWRLREKRPAYALVLQGGAVGVLYLTVFAALRLFSLIPAGPAFAVLFVFSAFSATLAVLQNARALAVLAAAGGFLAPVLISTGAGSHIHLFSYYLILNLGILGIAWFRAWRILNLVGFGFTFVIATAWGAKYYNPIFFSTTEPFLIAFALMYIVISALFAFRQPVHLRGYVDATLVFGVPLVGFALQAALVKDMPYGLAWSAIAAAAFYVALAWLLFNRLGRDSRLLAEAFLAIGVVFATLTIPLALDARWTAGMWALEGAAIVWVGRRQARLLPRLFGYLLQGGAGVSFLYSAQQIHHQLPVLNGLFIGALVIAVAGLFTAWYVHHHRDQLYGPLEPRLHPFFLIWGLLWWYGAWLFEIINQVDDKYWVLAVLLVTAGSSSAARLLQAPLV